MAATPGVPTAVLREGRIQPPPMPYGELELQTPPPLYAGEGAMSKRPHDGGADARLPRLGGLRRHERQRARSRATSPRRHVPPRLPRVRRGDHLAGPVGQDGPGDEQPARVPQLPARHTADRAERRGRAAPAPHLDAPGADRARGRRRGAHPRVGASAERRRLAPRPVCARSAAAGPGAPAAGVRHHRPARPGVRVGPAPPARDAPDPPRPADGRRRCTRSPASRSPAPRSTPGPRREPCSCRRRRSTPPTSWSSPCSPSPLRFPHWDWVKWLPHAQSRREADAAGPRRLVITDLDELVVPAAGRPQRAAAVRAASAARSRRTWSSSSTTSSSRSATRSSPRTASSA